MAHDLGIPPWNLFEGPNSLKLAKRVYFIWGNLDLGYIEIFEPSIIVELDYDYGINSALSVY